MVFLHSTFLTIAIVSNIKQTGLTIKHETIMTQYKKCWVVLTQLWVKYGHTQPLG